MAWFFFGMALGVLLALPLVIVAARRTERRVRRLEKRARTAERLAELGTMTGGLAHEIKNPLSTVGLNIQLLQEDVNELGRHFEADSPELEQVQRLGRRLESLTRETQRLRDILEDFLHFAGRIKLDPKPIDLRKLIDELVDFYEPQAAAANIRLRTQLADVPQVKADGPMLKQSLLNLLLNATQAMERARQNGDAHGGADELLIRTAHLKEEVAIHVIDTGPGMDQDTRKKIFRPYFSTRPGGSGLGLAVSRRIIEEHHGSLTVHSELGRGSDFQITLPVNEENASVKSQI